MKEIDISNTDIDSGLEYLPSSVKKIKFSTKIRPQSKVSHMVEDIKDYLCAKIKKAPNLPTFHQEQKKWEEPEYYNPNPKRWGTPEKTEEREGIIYKEILPNNFKNEVQKYKQNELPTKLLFIDEVRGQRKLSIVRDDECSADKDPVPYAALSYNWGWGKEENEKSLTLI